MLDGFKFITNTSLKQVTDRESGRSASSISVSTPTTSDFDLRKNLVDDDDDDERPSFSFLTPATSPESVDENKLRPWFVNGKCLASSSL